MILSDRDIQTALENGEMVVDPAPDEVQFSSSALDLRLGSEFMRWNENLLGHGVEVVVNPAEIEFAFVAGQYMQPVPRELDGSVIISPGQFMLALTRERIELPESSCLAARVEGRSTLARLGLAVHVTAPTIHAGFRGRITLEMVNQGPLKIRLVPDRLRVCQLIFERVSGPPGRALDSSFQDQESVTGR